MADINNLLDDIEENNDDSIINGIEDNANDTLLESLDQTETAEVPLELRNAGALRDKESQTNAGAETTNNDETIDPPEGHDHNTQMTDDDIFTDDDHFELDDDYQELRRLWIQEMSCPELLPHNTDIFKDHVEQLNDKEDLIDDLQDRAAEPRTPGNSDPLLASLVASIHRVEADRIRFMLADLTRIRLGKIESHALHNRTLLDRMSEEEVAYLKNYGELLETHMRRTVLNNLPKGGNWDKLDDPEMIDKPNLDSYVFCKILETVDIDNHKGLEGLIIDEDDDDEVGGNIQEHLAGSCLFVRYATIRDLILEGKAELLM